jgi:hypothetical protein
MAAEKRRACGYRKVGGLYLVSDGLGASCCKLPIILKTCPCCGNGVKQARGWTWIDPSPWIKGECKSWNGKKSMAGGFCPLADPRVLGQRVGLLWIGEQFYPTPEAFAEEANEMGISRRITAVPRGFKVGEHWVFLAHPKLERSINPDTKEAEWAGGVFRVFKPTRIEKIITESQSKDEIAMKRLELQKITSVIVPDDDKDHQGTVYDKDEADGDLFAEEN